MTNLQYNDPWAISDQPEVEWVDQGWFRRDKIVLQHNYGVSIPPSVRDEAPTIPACIVIPQGFLCDGRSTPLGLLARDHPAGLLHDWCYRVPAWIEFLDQRTLWLARQLMNATRRDVDLVFLRHLKAVGKQQPLVHWNPWRVRAFHASTRHSQWLAVRSPAGKAAWDKWRMV